MRVLLLIAVLYVIPFLVSAQDTIFVKTGQKIVCRVINSDSVNVYYDIMRKGQSVRAVISKQEVQNVKYCAVIKSVIKTKSNAVLASVGASIALGAFSSDDVHSDIAGLAGNGINANLIFTHSFTPTIHLALKGFYSRNKFKADRISNMLSSSIGLPVDNNSVSYSSKGILMGPGFLNIMDKLSVSGHVLLGYGNLNQPSTVFSVYSTSGSGWVTMSEISAGSLIYDFGLGLIYNITQDWDIVANGDYINGSYKFGPYKVIGASGVTEQFNRGTQKYQVFNISMGLCLKL